MVAIMNNFRKIYGSPSIIVIISIMLFVACVNNNQSPAKNGNIIQHDIVNYYSYLPAFFIEKDIALSFLNKDNETKYFNENKYAPAKTEEGKRVIKVTMGMSIMYAPFFAIAHLLAEPLGYEPTGFSYPYQLMLLVSGLFYLTSGFLFLRKSLLKFFNEKTTAITIGIVYFASNLVCYSTLQSAYSHQYTFCLLSVLIFASIKWHEKPNWKYTFLIGSLLGLMSLVRVINVMFILVFVFYNISTLEQFKDRIKLFFRNYLLIIGIVITAVLFFSPQMMYWKYITGQYFFNSYVGEKFYFLSPHVLQCLVGFRKGWLIYSPIFIFSFIGIYLMVKQKEGMFLSVLILLPLYYYIVASWWCWWYGGSFGLRSMIDLYPLLTFPLAVLIKRALESRKWVKGLVIGFFALFIALNLFQTIQFHYNIINYDSMTYEAYKDRFFKITRAECDRSLLRRPDYEKCRLFGTDDTIPYVGE
jgi:hypothetical protein